MKTDLITIPNVGEKTKQSLLNIGITCVEDLKGKSPEDLYFKDCVVKGYKVDRCQLYLFRMAVYYAEHTTWEDEKLKWWYWKDKENGEVVKSSVGFCTKSELDSIIKDLNMQSQL